MATAADLDIKMDATSLYREEIYTDRRIGTIRAMVPVTAKGDTDPARETLYIGEAQIMTQMGPLPVTFEIEADLAGQLRSPVTQRRRRRRSNAPSTNCRSCAGKVHRHWYCPARAEALSVPAEWAASAG